MDQGNLLPLSAENIIQLLKNEFRLSFSKRGQDYFTFCPFHKEKTSSFAFEPEKKFFKCFGCGFGVRNFFELWAQIKGVSLVRAKQEIKQLGYQVGSEETLSEQKENNQEKKLLSLVSKIYQHNLCSLIGKKVYAYLKQKRQLDYSIIQQFVLGCSVSHQQLTNLFSSSEEAKQLLLLNLLRSKENNKISDFFGENQLIIPLHNEKGEIVAFAARQTTQDPLWINSKYNYLPNYENYQKSKLLYNYFRVKQISEDFCYLVEGFFDVISLTQKGINNCLASLGTMLSKQQVNLIKKLKKKIIIFLDGDSAGKQATIKIALTLLACDIECEIINHSLSLDPDEICQQKQGELTCILQKKEDPYFYILQHFAQVWEIRENPQSVQNFIRKIAKLFKNFSSKVQDFLIEKISSLIRWSQTEVKEVYFAEQKKEAETSHKLTETNVKTKEKYLLAYCCQSRRYWLTLQQAGYIFSQPENRYLYQCLHNFYTTEPYLEADFNKLTFSNSDKIELQEIIDEINLGSVESFFAFFQEG